ncbi:DUF4428 domain-containing protein [Olsenella sp. HMSC062G07]|uniref:DUF4428 domain-containing protein n=1 Tax=Olsenella sp. HMSC062G07 TaxID=1739330 RepID=UPI0008A1BF85|nr:DUF4428 domain-containing protein [Olsenella sp. HMSC062G07]OFK22424.1 hypothetical protein HMPREF2826_01370 [Olsenella sp. HMSC062G07]
MREKATCDICGKKLGFRKFKYSTGVICKDCYKLASESYTTTIAEKTFDEVMAAYDRRKSQLESDVNFLPTKRVANYLQIDERRELICLPNNRLIGLIAGDKEGLSAPEYIKWADVYACSIVTTPRLTQSQMRGEGIAKGTTISSLSVEIKTRRPKASHVICFLKNKTRVKSFAFRHTFDLAKRCVDMVNQYCIGKES